jgi:hypothetical protein
VSSGFHTVSEQHFADEAFAMKMLAGGARLMQPLRTINDGGGGLREALHHASQA